MRNYFSLKSSLKLLFLSIFLSSCQKEVDNQEIKQETVKETTSEKNENTKPPKNLKNNLSKNPEKIKIDTMVQLENETLIFKEISKAEFDQKYRSSNPSDLLYYRKLKDFKRKYKKEEENAWVDYTNFITSQNLIKDSAKVKYRVYKVQKGNNYFVNEGILRLKLDNGKVLVLNDNLTGGESTKHYEYREIIDLDNVSFFVYRQDNWEGGNYVLVNTVTGKQDKINGIPQVSPNKRYILNTPYNLGTYFNYYNGILLFDCSEGYAKLKWKFYPYSEYEPYIWRSCWLDNQTILCEIITYNDKHKENYHYAIITIKSGKKN